MNKHPLVDVLVKQDGLHQELLELSLNKTEVLKANNLEALERIVLEEQKLIVMLRQVEELREKVVGQMLTGVANPTVSDCLEGISDESVREALRSVQESLYQKLTDLKAQQELNEQLIRHSLQYINMTLSFVQPTEQLPSYGASGQVVAGRPQERTSMFDSKA